MCIYTYMRILCITIVMLTNNYTIIVLYVGVCVYIYIYIYVHAYICILKHQDVSNVSRSKPEAIEIEREREGGRERERERGREGESYTESPTQGAPPHAHLCSTLNHDRFLQKLNSARALGLESQR